MIHTMWMDPLQLASSNHHLWTYAVGLSDDSAQITVNDCPCVSVVPGAPAPAFVVHHYYCESANVEFFPYTITVLR